MHKPPAHRNGQTKPFDLKSMGQAIHDFLVAAGVDPNQNQLAGTPERVAKAWSEEFLDGYENDPARILQNSFETPPAKNQGHSEIVLAKDIAFHGLCPHHLLPFQGEAHVGYVPNGRYAPFSALARLVDCFAHRLEVQETVTREIVEALIVHLGAQGAAAILESQQSCMTVRGVKRRESRIVTTHFAGVLSSRADLRRDFLRLVEKG